MTIEELPLRYTSTFVLFYVAVIMLTWLVMIFAVLIDLWTGIEKAKAKGEKIDSHNLRRTFTKIGDYWRVQAFGFMVDIFASLWITTPVASMVVGLGVLIIEARSVVENLREKKSAAAELPDLIAKIVEAKDTKDASAILELLRQTTKEKEGDNATKD